MAPESRKRPVQGAPGGQAGSETKVTVPPGTDVAARLPRRRDAAYRLPPLDCGCRDPWLCDARHGTPVQGRGNQWGICGMHLDLAAREFWSRQPEPFGWLRAAA